MIRTLAMVALALAAVPTAASAQQATPSPAPTVEVTRLDCGTNYANDLNLFSDTMAYVGQSKALTASCYLIEHGDERMLWDAGNPRSLLGTTNDATKPIAASLSTTLVDQLARLKLRPADIAHVGVSHLHGDHIGQLPDFAGAELLIGQGDWDAITAPTHDPSINPAPFAAWRGDDARRRTPAGDLDVWGDGSVVMIALPGHTPGHHALLVRRTDGPPVILAGDQAHFTENMATHGVPGFNTDRADTLASFDRIERLATNLGATVVLGHEPAHIPLLPSVEDR